MANVRYVDLISFTDRDLDRFGARFVENEEIMLDLVRRELGSKSIFETVSGAQHNATVPVFLPIGSGAGSWNYGWSNRIYIHFKPSRALFDRLFAGKQINVARGKKDLRPATFEEIGWTGK
jgi:hypothetical protein